MHYCWVMLAFTCVQYFYLFLEFWERYDVVCFRLGRPPVHPKFLTRNTLLASCRFTFLRSSVMCWEAWSDRFIWSWIHQFFLWLICGVPTLKCILFGQFTCSVTQVLVWDVVLPGGWCTFCFYLVGHSSHCSCYLWWRCFIPLTLLVVGCLWQGFFTAKLYLGQRRVSCVLVTTSFGVVVPVEGSLDVQWSGLSMW